MPRCGTGNAKASPFDDNSDDAKHSAQRRVVIRRAAILGYGAVPVGSYQKAVGNDAVLEHELGTKVVLDAMAMALSLIHI